MGDRRARRQSPLVGAVWLLGACAAKAREPQPLPAPASSGVASSASLPVATAQPLPAFEALAARQVRLAPGMRELARGDLTAPTPLPKVDHDTCVRVAFAAAGPARVALVGRDHAELAAAAAASEGALGGRGPVCFHADDAPTLVAAGDAGAVRYVVWGAP